MALGASVLAARRLALFTAISRSSHEVCSNFSSSLPQTLEGPVSAAIFGEHEVFWERVQLQTEPGELGKVVLLIAKPASQSKRFPAVLIMHPTGGSKEDVAKHLERYARKGFFAAAFDARYHGERALPNAGLQESKA